MADNDKKPIVHVVPAVLTGVAALIAALTTVYVNVRGDRHEVATSPAPVAAVTKTATAMVAAQPMRVDLRLQRIAVQHDGSVGTTDWRFAVQADGQPLFVFSQDDLDETGGRNVAVPKDATGELRLQPGKPVVIAVQGWRGSRLRLMPGAPDANGQGRLSGTGELAPITVVAAEPDDGSFVFYFSAEPE